MTASPAGPTPVVRPGTFDDIDGAIRLTGDVAAERQWIGTEPGFDPVARAAMFRDLLTDTAAGTVLVVDPPEPEAGAGLAGLLTLRVAGYGVADLGMMVAERWRGRGVGRALLAAAIEWARQAESVHKIALQHWPHNHAAHRLYRSAGFTVEGRLHRHYRRRSGEAWDAIVMGLVVDPRVRGASLPAPGAPQIPDAWRPDPSGRQDQ